MLVFLLLILGANDASCEETTTQVDLRAVLIDCEPLDSSNVPFENEDAQFEREEQFKHSILTDCDKKLAVTIKIANRPELNSDDEYIPIEHVFQGATKRLRLLNPYVLRLKKEPPVQAYTLNKIDRNTQLIDFTTKGEQGLQQETHILHSNYGTEEIKSSTTFQLDNLISNMNEEIDPDDSTINKPRLQKPEPYEVNTKIEWPEDEPNNNFRNKKQNNSVFKDIEKDFHMYEIGKGELWYTLQVQLFEKNTTPEGNVVWNDLNEGKLARVSSLSPEWKCTNVSVLYKPTEWMPKENFTFPMNSLCLLAPLSHGDALKRDEAGDHYIVVPRDDVVFPTVVNNETISDVTDSYSSQAFADIPSEKPLQRVTIRTARALFYDSVKMNIVSRNGKQYLTLLHDKPFHAQVHLEARADDNQLVNVGCSGRIMSVVSDSSWPRRTVLTVQATNTGLAAAYFKVVARECNPELPQTIYYDKINEEDPNFHLFPPKHTQTLHIDIIADIPEDLARCTVALINKDHQMVAMRDVSIRKRDRCFCVWHCKCVCLGEDPKLLCSEMAVARQRAAGLSPRHRSRLVRALCYHDVLALNFCITAIGVLLILLIFGLAKACLGLCCSRIGWWGLERVLQVPRPLHHYYEPELRGRCVVYDSEGWPVHPDTKERTVRQISLPMEFLLNTIYFLTAPCVMVYEAVKQLCGCCKVAQTDAGWSSYKGSGNKCYSSRENIVQSSSDQCRWRGGGTRLQPWMTPEAEKLTSHVMQSGVPTHASMIKDFLRPLLTDELNRGDAHESKVSCTGAGAPSGDSDVEDTEYVLMQMQKSRESLVRSQRKLNCLSGSVINK